MSASLRRTATAGLVGVFVLGVLAQPAAAQQLEPVGGEFQVNTHTTDSQWFPAVAPGANGGFVVVWASDLQDGSSYGVFGQRFASDGSMLGGEFPVNTYTTGRQRIPVVASDSDGNFLVAWDSELQDGSTWAVFGQRFASDGTALGGEFQVNTFTTNDQESPSVAPGANGDFVVVWATSFQHVGGQSIAGQRFASDGSTLGGEFRVDTSGGRLPAVASNPNGGFVVAWEGLGGIAGQRFAPDASTLGDEFVVAAGRAPAVAVAADGGFVVMWQTSQITGPPSEVQGQRYASNGAPIGGEFLVNTYTTYSQSYPTVSPDSNGGFVVVWASDNQDGSSYGVFGQRLASDGTPLGGEFQVNSFTTGDQGASTAYHAAQSVSPLGNGHFVVVWNSAAQDGSSDGVFGQRFIDPTFIFADGFESGDTSKWSSTVP